MRGYECGDVDRLLAEIADSYAAVWNERTTLYGQVLELRAQSTAGEATIAMLRDEVERAKAECDTLLVQLEHAEALLGKSPAAVEPHDPGPGDRRGAEEATSFAEQIYRRTQADRPPEEPDPLYEDVLRPRAIAPGERDEPRKTLREMMVDALRESGLGRSERASSNGSEGARRTGALFDPQDAPDASPGPEE